MEALILSCGTGGGHNAAGFAVREELERRGHHVTMMDPYTLVSDRLADAVSNVYIKTVQKTPALFGVAYWLGNEVRRIPGHSPVYAVNQMMARRMHGYLEAHHYDVVLMPHVFPGEILTCMKEKGMPVPKTIFIATDYACIPFTEETSCDCYVTPARDLNADFAGRGIPAEKLLPAGIPTRAEFRADVTRAQAVRALGLEPDRRHLLLCGGSIGAGQIVRTVRVLLRYIRKHPDLRLIVVCGSNQALLDELMEKYENDRRVRLIGRTDQMGLYMRACDACLSKPGGLSSTEAAVSGVPLIHLSPIPGCENINMRYFHDHGVCFAVGDRIGRLPEALDHVLDPDFAARMQARQRKRFNPLAASDICDCAERLAAQSE